jgi:hypothetical protein
LPTISVQLIHVFLSKLRPKLEPKSFSQDEQLAVEELKYSIGLVQLHVKFEFTLVEFSGQFKQV